MPAKARLALGTTALCAIVLLPFAARFFDERQTAVHTRTAVSDAALLIRRQQFESAYGVLSRGGPGSHAKEVIHQYRLAVCERALGMADSAYARLLRLEGAIPVLENYRRLWVARSLEIIATSGDDSAAAISGYRDLLALQVSSAVADSARLYMGSAQRNAGHFAESL